MLVAVVAGGALGPLARSSGEVADQGGGYELEVEYPRISRAGQPAPLHIVIRRPGGFSGEVVQIGICGDLFDALDFQNWYPNPSGEVSSGGRLVYEFDAPPGDTLELSLDARIGPGELGGFDDCTVAVREGERSVASVEFGTWRLP